MTYRRQDIVGWKRRRVWNEMLCLCVSSVTSMTTWWAHSLCLCVGTVASSQVRCHSCLLLGSFHCPSGAAFFPALIMLLSPPSTHVDAWCNALRFCGLLFIDGFNIMPVTNRCWRLQGNSTNASKKIRLVMAVWCYLSLTFGFFLNLSKFCQEVKQHKSTFTQTT